MKLAVVLSHLSQLVRTQGAIMMLIGSFARSTRSGRGREHDNIFVCITGVLHVTAAGAQETERGGCLPGSARGCHGADMCLLVRPGRTCMLHLRRMHGRTVLAAQGAVCRTGVCMEWWIHALPVVVGPMLKL